MTRSRTTSITISSALAMLCAGEAAADVPMEPVRLVYSAPAQCPEQRDFTSDVIRRTSAALFVDDQRAQRTFFVQIEKKGGRFVGRVRTDEQSNEPGERRFEDPDCGEVVRSLALVVALAIDPNAESGELPPAEPAPKPPGEQKPKPKPKPAEPAKPRPAASTPRAHAARRPESQAAVEPTLSWELEALVFMQAGVAPEPLTGAGLGVRSTLSELGPLREPSFALQILAADSEIAGPDTGPATYGWIVSRELACPLNVFAGSRAALRPCLVADLGIVSGAGEEIARPRTSTGFFGSLGAQIEAAWQPAGPFVVGVTANVQANIARHHFVFDRPRRIVHEIPALSFGAAIDLGWIF